MIRQSIWLAAGALSVAWGTSASAADSHIGQSQLFQRAAYSLPAPSDRMAEDYGQALVRLDPDEADVFYKKALAYLKAGQYDRAIEQYDIVLRSYPEFSPALINRGAANAAKGNYERAVRDYDRAIRLNPVAADAYVNRGLALERLGEAERAIADFDEAVRLQRGIAEVFDGRGMAYARLGEYGKAVADFDAAIKLKPGLSDAFSNRGSAYARLEQFEQAIADFDEAIRLRPNFGQAFGGRGQARFFLGRFADAAADFESALKLRPADTYNVLWTALALAQSGQDNRVLLSETLPKLQSDRWPEPLILLLAGKVSPEEVLAKAQSSTTANRRERSTEAYFYIGQYQLLRGSRTKAAEAFRAAVGLEADTLPEYIGALAELSRLRN